VPLLKREIDQTRDVLTIDWRFGRSADAVWEHLTDPEHLSEWLGQPVSFDGTPGGEILIDHGDGYICRSVVKRVEPADYLFEITWLFPDEHPTQVEVVLRSPPGEGTKDASILTLRHLDLAELCNSYAQGWVTHLTFFEASLDGTSLPLDEFWNLHATIVALSNAT
jgi:uncharacterized protein YndB with AHSA1/START domain